MTFVLIVTHILALMLVLHTLRQSSELYRTHEDAVREVKACKTSEKETVVGHTKDLY